MVSRIQRRFHSGWLWCELNGDVPRCIGEAPAGFAGFPTLQWARLRLRAGYGGLGMASHGGGSPTAMASHSKAVSRPKGAKGGSFPLIGFTGESPNLTVVTKGLGRICDDTAVLAELRWLTAAVATELRQVLGQANHVMGWQSDGECHRPLLVS
jgi:hypothetical protein